ncbi:hypothetical protein RYO59_001998 [Thermosynechococcaceae cyanobacterium Okahandja]
MDESTAPQQLSFPWHPVVVENQPTVARFVPDSPHQRIQHLEQAVDQCQTYIDELKQQLRNQQFLEDLLARTEETALIQQQAILTLQEQLHSQAACTHQLAEMTSRRQSLETIVQQSQAEIQHLHQEVDRLLQLQDALEAKLVNSHRLLRQREHDLQLLESQQRQTTEEKKLLQTRLEQLQQELRECQDNIQNLTSRLSQANHLIETQERVISALQQAQLQESNKNTVIQGLSKTLLKTQATLQELEREYQTQRLQHMKVQHYNQELENRVAQQQARLQTLEQQVAELQEQILYQAQQAREQETAVQHWKDRCGEAERIIEQLRRVIAQMATHKASPAEAVPLENTP